MQHKSVVQTLMGAKPRLPAQVVILLMDLRSLGKARLLFMDRLGHKNPRIVFVQFQQQRRTVRHHRDKLFVTHPGRIKQDVIAKMTDFIDDLTGVVDGAIVSTQLDHRQAERARLIGTLGRGFADQLTQVRFIEAVLINPADKPKRIACRLQIHRRRACLDQRAVVV